MVTVNAMGDNCPIPVIKTKKAMQALTGPETIEVLVDNEIAVQNVTKLAKEQGGEVSSEKLGEKEYNYNSKTHSIDFICGKCYCNFHNDDDAEYEDIWWTIKMNDKNQLTPDTVVNFDRITDWQIW